MVVYDCLRNVFNIIIQTYHHLNCLRLSLEKYSWDLLSKVHKDHHSLQTRNTYHSIRSIQIASLYLIQAGITPIQLLGFVVNCKAIGHPDLGRNNGFHSNATDQGPLDGRGFWVPVCPVNKSEKKGRKSLYCLFTKSVMQKNDLHLVFTIKSTRKMLFLSNLSST